MLSLLCIYVDPSLKTFKGYCRDPSNNKQIIEYIHASSSAKCQDLCIHKSGCVAFAFEQNDGEGGTNCDLYDGGPYTQGTGANDITCYILSKGIFLY